MFYTYLWLREDGTPYYAGKGQGKRNTHPHRGGKWKHPPKERIIVQHFDTEEQAFMAERFLIEFYGRKDLGTGCLRNLTDGGDGSLGYKPTEATLIKLSLSHKGYTPVTAKLPWSSERKLRKSQERKGKPNGCLGTKRSEESRQKMRAARLAFVAAQRKGKNYVSNSTVCVQPFG